MRRQQPGSSIFHVLGVMLGAAALTVLPFLVLPLIQAIGAQDEKITELQDLDFQEEEEEDEVEEEEEEEEPEEEEPQPELEAEAPPLDLAQLDIALDPGGFSGDGWGSVFQSSLDALGTGGASSQSLNLAQLGEKPRALQQVPPQMNERLKKRSPATVWLRFIVDERGRVRSPKVLRSTDPLFEKPALAAIKKWRFEPGKRQGKASEYRLEMPMKFPKRS